MSLKLGIARRVSGDSGDDEGDDFCVSWGVWEVWVGGGESSVKSAVGWTSAPGELTRAICGAFSDDAASVGGSSASSVASSLSLSW